MKMKRIINTLIILAVSMLAFSCQETEKLEVTMNESIVLDLSSGLTKAEDTSTESFVNHLDIFIFKAVASGSGYSQGDKVYYGRYSVNNASSLVLNTKRSSYSQDDRFYVYLVANTKCPQADMEAVSTFNDLQNVMQSDEYIHLTGLNVTNAPKYFLMDAVAKDSSDNSPVQLNNGVPSDNTELTAELKRAAAKVVINITAGSDVVFNHFTLTDGSADPESDGGLYYIRNLPYDTYLLSGVDASIIEAQRRTTMKGSSAYFTWRPETVNNKVSLIAYVYPHHWTNASILTDETCVIMNLPMVFKPGTAEEFSYKNSWYKIPMSKDQKFERNHYYEVNITLNRPGATSDSNPQELTDIYYAVEDWTGVTVEVGKEEYKPLYLQLNTSHVDMYNINTDDNTLQFASSSPIKSVTLKEAYYVNSTDTRVYLHQSSDSADRNVFTQINATYTANVLNGGITIFSPFVKEGSSIADSHKNAIRYMTFEVENNDGLKTQFTVAQYPTLYITNEHGIYSYREDFNGRTSGVRWSGGSWSYVDNASQGSFFASKTAVRASNGTYSIRYANWNNGSYSQGTSLGMFNNPRMYHIHITATSKDYIVAKPILDSNGYTEMTAENSRLVSPSFLIASQLGATETSGGSSGVDIQKAIRHCKEYMEVTDGKVYKDWRLPTKAEIDIIEKHQHTSPAMAEVLNGSHYYCAYNPEYAQYADPGSPYYSQRRDWIYTVRDIGNSGSVHVRCVHDAYGN